MAGIQPVFLVLRSNDPIDELRKEKVAVQCNLSKDRIIMNANIKSIYSLPNKFKDQDFDKKALKLPGLPLRKINDKKWNELVKVVTTVRKNRVTVGIVGKYFATEDFQLPDSYNSLTHALKHASWKTGIGADFKFVNAEDIEKENAKKFLKDVNGIIVPIGWGSRGVEGKIQAVKFARETKTPYLGLCYGMQLACVEYARNVLNLKGANSEEVNPDVENKIIHSIPFNSRYQTIKGEGTSMRLGSFDCVIKKGTLMHEIYKKHKEGKKLPNGDLLISERHRHRFEFNNDYRKQFEDSGFIFSGTYPDDFFC